jgi:phytoene synthase
MIEARIFDLCDDQMPPKNNLEGYCGEPAGPLIQLGAGPGCRAPGWQNGGTCRSCASDGGTLALLPRHRARRQSCLLQKLLAAVRAEAEDLFVSVPSDAAQRAVAAIITLARDHLVAFEGTGREDTATLLPAYLPVTLEKVGPTVLQHAPQLIALHRYDAILRHAVAGWCYRVGLRTP